MKRRDFMDFNLSVPVRVVSGKGIVKEKAALFSAFGKRCLIVTGGKSAVLSGALEDVKAALEENEISFEIFDKITPNPYIEDCHLAGVLARESKAEFIIGIGGGSALDAAKAVAVYAANEDFLPFDIYEKKERNIALPLVLIGTTAGTGSEVGSVSVLSNKKNGRKKSINFADCAPKLTFADSTYTHSIPYSVTVSTALDALSHAIEGYLGNKCTDIPTMFAEKAIPMIWEGLKYLEKEKRLPDAKMREQLYYGSLYAGITLSYCGTAFPHPLGYILTENFGVPHGFACAAFMPELIRRAVRYERDKARRLFNLMKTNSAEFFSVIMNLCELGDIVMTEDELSEWCERWNTVPGNFLASPGGFTKEEAKTMLRNKFVKTDLA